MDHDTKTKPKKVYKSANERKTLLFRKHGLSFSSVRARMMRNIALDWIKIKFDNLCYRCGEPMTDVKRITLEHLVDLSHGFEAFAKHYADVEMIRGSHLECNVAHSVMNKTDGAFQRRQEKIKAADGEKTGEE